MSPARRRVARVVTGTAVVAVAVVVAGPAAVARGIEALDVRLVVLATALTVPATVACAWRWRLVSRALGGQLAFRPAVAACYAAQFLNTTLPGGVVGDVRRGIVHGMAGGDTARALRVVAWERLVGQVVLAALAVSALALLPSPLPGQAVVAGAAALTGGALLVARGVRLRAEERGGPSAWGRMRRTARADVSRMLTRAVWPGAALASVLAVACHAVTYLAAARAVGVTAPVSTLLPLVLLVFVAAALPINVAGWGPREGMAAWSFAAAGIGADAGLAAGVAYGVVVLVANLPGAAALLTGAGHPAGEPERSRVRG